MKFWTNSMSLLISGGPSLSINSFYVRRLLVHRLGFHVPPYISVTHLHMHVQALPHRTFLRRLKYPIVRGRGGREKGISWFVDAEQAVRILERGSRIRILSC